MDSRILASINSPSFFNSLPSAKSPGSVTRAGHVRRGTCFRLESVFSAYFLSELEPVSATYDSLSTSRHRKCDETKPNCNNCVSINRVCGAKKMRQLFDTDGPLEKGHTSERKSKTTKQREPDMDAKYTAISNTSSIPVPRANTSVDSYSTKSRLNDHNLQPTSSLGTLHNESVDIAKKSVA